MDFTFSNWNLLFQLTIFKEEFTKAHFVGFAFIWIGLIIYSLSQVNLLEKTQRG